MRVGFVGLGKLGLPVATTMASSGLTVTGYDPRVNRWPTEFAHEQGFQQEMWSACARGSFHFGSMEQACRSEVVFVAVQTPHEPEYEGITPIPDDRRDFDYGHLVTAITQIKTVCDTYKLHPVVTVISTVLPGTMAREVQPRLGSLRLVYNPSFIAMGTVIEDFLNPEFVLLGGPKPAVEKVKMVYRQVLRKHKNPIYREMSVPSAELTKVAYNTFIGLKLAFVNTLQELCQKTDASVGEVTGALKQADRRLISTAYLSAGMGDGGGCHPRDNIALSWLAREKHLSFDLFDAAMRQREAHAAWLADLLHLAAGERQIPAGILGLAYKPRSALTTGSPALLVENLYPGPLALRDPYVEAYNLPMPDGPGAWLIGCRHPEFADYTFPKGSVIIDPWRYIEDQDGVTVMRLGE